MEQLEENVIHSFKLAKSDIIKLQNDVIELSQSQERILEILGELKTHEQKLYQRFKDLNPKKVSKTVTKVIRAKKILVATKGGKNFHLAQCPFAQNIKPKNKVKFSSKTKALNDGYKPCKCVK